MRCDELIGRAQRVLAQRVFAASHRYVISPIHNNLVPKYLRYNILAPTKTPFFEIQHKCLNHLTLKFLEICFNILSEHARDC